jgi:adenylate cyclase
MGQMFPAHRRIRLLRILNGIGILLLLVMHDLGGRPFGLLSRLDLAFYDARHERSAPARDPRIVIVDIDDGSLARSGHWPWPQERLAQLNDILFEQGRPAVVGYKLFTGDLQALDGETDAFVRSLKGRPAVLGYYLGSSGPGASTGQLPQPVLDAEAASVLGERLVAASSYRANPGPLADSAVQGFLNAFPGAGIDPDGVIRALPLLARIDGGVQESFALAVLRKYLAAGSLAPATHTLRLESDEAALSIPVSDGYTAMIPFRKGAGPSGGRFTYLSAVDLLEGRVEPSLLHNRIVLVGSSAAGLGDPRPTPGNVSMPAVEIHASLIAGALDQSVPRRIAAAGAIAALMLLLVGGGLAALLPRLEPVPALAATSGALLLLAAANSLIDQLFGLVLPLSASLLSVLLILIFNLIFGYLVEGRSRGAVVRLFSEYLSPTLVEQMSTDPERWRSGEIANRELTILFADIRGFTRMAESMEPAVLRDYLNKVLTGMTAVVHRHGGTVDKYIGDAIMAFWGAPVEDPRHADRAVDAAIAMQQEARRLSADFVVRGLPALAIGIGVNTGVVQVGDMGSAARRTYTAIGDAVNLASRLEGLTKRYEVPIIIGESTVATCIDHLFDELGPAMVDGRSEPVRVFAPHFGPNAWIERTFGSLWRRRVPGRKTTGGERRLDRESV